MIALRVRCRDVAVLVQRGHQRLFVLLDVLVLELERPGYRWAQVGAEGAQYYACLLNTNPIQPEAHAPGPE